MHSTFQDRMALLAAEVAANLAEVARWDWSTMAQEAAALSREIADGVYEGRAPEEMFELFAELTGFLDEPLWHDPAVFLRRLGTRREGADTEALRDAAQRAFIVLRAELYPEGRRVA